MSIFQQYSNFRDYFRNSPLTVIILGINTVMLLLTYFIGWQEGFGIFDGISGYALYKLGGLWPPIVKEGGEYYRILTSMFLHGSLFHYLSNMIIGVYVLSGSLERMIGTKKFAILYFVSGIGSGILVTFLSTSLTIGASGAIFGVLGALLYITIYRQDMVSMRDVQTIRTLVFINIIFTFLSFTNISIPGHVGGILTGYLLSYVLIRRNVFKVIN